MSKAKEIIDRYFKEEYSEDIQKKFFLWLNHPVKATEKEYAFSQLWEDLSVSSDLSTERSFQQTVERLGGAKKNQRHQLYIRIARVAAVLLIPFLSFLSAWLYIQHHESAEMDLIECYVAHGEIREIILPDNSTALVNSGSILLYPKEFKGKKRDIYLSGEAKFMVVSDKKKPFIVRTNDLKVEALGTIFNVSSFPDNAYTTTTLVEGKIVVDINSTKENYVLKPKEQIVYDRKTGKSILKETRIDYVLSWEKGQMVFQSTPLSSIIKVLERHYGVVVYLNTDGLKDEKLTVKFMHNETLQEVLHTLQQIITGFNYEIEGDKIYINY